MLDDFCYAEFLSCYTLENKSSKTSEYQPDELDNNFTENNQEECSYPPKIKLLFSGETMRYRKLKRILRYQVPSKLLSPEKCAHHLILLFFFNSEMKNNCYLVGHHCIKKTCKNKESRIL